GILVLTTNRKKDFDEAFKSRVHVKISYPALDEDAQAMIWRRLIEHNSEVTVYSNYWTDDV
ncbi:hypothetical protein QBC38DRAFT_375086, partial [Podospora fimiseda]